MGHVLHELLFAMAGWIAEVLFMLFYPPPCNGQNIAACEAYWFKGFPIINH